MQMAVAYVIVGLFLAGVVLSMELTKRQDETFSDFATAGRSFGSFFTTMAFVNTWLPGTIFISFAGLVTASGMVGFYFTLYGMLGLVLMFFLSQPVFRWGHAFDLRTQADLLGLRYGSHSVRLVAAVIGIVASFPWVILGMQSLGLVFTYLSFGHVGPYAGVIVGILVIAARQVWTVRFGMRGVVISDMVQGVFAYFVGTALIVGLLVWLVTNGHGFADVDPARYGLPRPGSALGGLYLFSLVLTGALGSWCWPDIFVRLFTSRSARTMQRAAVQSAPILLVFGILLSCVALVGSTLPGAASRPDDIWFIVASHGGTIVLALAGVCVVGASLGNVGANLQAIGTMAANDVVAVAQRERVEKPFMGRVFVAVFTVLATLGALLTAHSASGLITLAIMSYQGIVQIAPTLFLGVFWRRGNALAATSSMVVGFVTACVLQALYPTSIPWLDGVTSGVAALVVNVAVYLATSLAVRPSRTEQERVDRLFDLLRTQPAAGGTSPTLSTTRPER